MSLERSADDISAIEVRRTRHILGLSGGKDSAALAIYLKDQIATMGSSISSATPAPNFRRFTST